MSPLARRRFSNFKANRRGFYSTIIFFFILLFTILAEFIASDQPIIVIYKGETYLTSIFEYPETTFGGDFPTATNYRDPFIADIINRDGRMIWPLIRFSHSTINYDLPVPAPAPPSKENILGTDDQGRDVAARLIYGLRLSILFGLMLTTMSSLIGIIAGVVQGYFGGFIDLFFQRFLEIWGGMPQLFILIIVTSVLVPGFWTLLFILMLFSWTSLVGVVRAEVLRGRNFEYVRAAKALGASDLRIMLVHILPNAMVATFSLMPFILSSSITALTALDFLGLGLPPGSPSLGDILRQGKENLQAPWLGLTGFIVMAGLLTLLVFIGEAVRDAFDPRKTFQ